MFGKLGAPEILLVLLVVVVLFGAKRMPDMARSLGQSLRILKSETKAMRSDDLQPEGTTEAEGATSPLHLAPRTAEGGDAGLRGGKTAARTP